MTDTPARHSGASWPDGAISYEEWLRGRIAEPGWICGPPVIDTRPFWQHLPGLNPYAELERRARATERDWAASSRVPGDRARKPEQEAEAG